MLIHGVTYPLWLLLLRVSGIGSLPFSLFNTDTNPEQPQEGNVRLAGSKTVSEGRVEIYHDGKWGTVCDDGWGLAEAQVVCRQLQFPGAKAPVAGGAYGEGSGPIWLDDMDCKGTENFLSGCSFKGWALTDCTHKEDAGVICEGMNLTFSDTNHFLDHSLGLSEDLGQLFDTGDSCDFLILVNTPTGNTQEDGTLEMLGTTVCAHKIILSRFPRFNASEGNSSISVHLSQACEPHFTSFIRYIYTRKIDVTISSAQCLYQMAVEFGVKQLMEDTGRMFTKLLPEDVTFHTQVSLYEYSVQTGDLLLQENCLQYLAWNYQNLTTSPAWSRLSVELLAALLSRSDLVVPDESFLLLSLESWISEEGKSISTEDQADLLGHVRFPMIPAETLYELQFNSALYKTHRNLYRDKMLKGFQLNALPFGALKNSSLFDEQDQDYQPRIYTGEPWSTDVDSNNIQTQNQPRNAGRNNQYGGRVRYGYDSRYHYYATTVSPYHRSKSFRTPAHGSVLFKNDMIQWEANVFFSQYDCTNKGLRCESFPVARLTGQNSQYRSKIRFNNRLLLLCQGKFICQVQDFKNDLAYVPSNGNQTLPYPCPGDQYTYRFVVRPEYI
ncbi:galectin-3-binding protein B-like [Polymixia lowei]